jgi:hypothetical protein
MALTALPDPPETADPANFATKADALVAALAVMVSEINAGGAQTSTLTAGRIPRAASTGGALTDDANSPTCDASGHVAVVGTLTSATQKSSIRLNTLATTPTNLATNQHGTTSTGVLRFTTKSIDSGTDFTHATAETTGSTITINRAGLYAITACFRDGGAGITASITKNSTSLTVGLSATALQNLASGVLAAGASGVRQSLILHSTSWLAVNDVIRFQETGSTDSDNTTFNYVQIDAVL